MKKLPFSYNSKIFEWIGIFLSVISVLSLFGKLGIVTFDEWMLNFLSSYRKLVHPIVDIILRPIYIIYNFELNSIQKDSLIFYIFLFDRYLIEFFSVSVNFKYQGGVIFNIKPAKSKIHMYYYISNMIFSKYINEFFQYIFRIINNNLLIKKSIAIIISIIVIIFDNESKDYWFIGGQKNEQDVILNLTIMLFIIPIFCLFMHIVLIIFDLAKFLLIISFKILGKNIDGNYNIKTILKNSRVSPVLLIAIKQSEFSIYFITILLVAVGVGRDQGFL